jgi:integrase/recombinase XerC
MKELQSFLDYIQYEKRFSKHTVQGYRKDLEQFFYFVKETFDIDDESETTKQIIRSWVVHQLQSNLTATSIRRKISSLQSYFKYLQKRGKLTFNPAKGVTLPKLGERSPVFIKQSELPALFTDSGVNVYKSVLAESILTMFYNTGMRRQELINLKIKDVNTLKKEIFVLGKGNKQRIIPMTLQLQQSIEKYLKIRPASIEAVSSDYFFLLENGRPLNVSYVYRLVRSRIEVNTQTQKASPHILRHSFASHLSQNGADLNAIKTLLGHSSLSSTQIYTHHSLEGLKRIYSGAHPKSKDDH